MPGTLGPRALNRALLARQLLLERADLPVERAVEHLVGLQAQSPLPPYQGLWSRLRPFDPHVLGGLIEDRRLVRLTLMRATVHLVTVEDAAALRPLVQPVVDRVYARPDVGAPPAEIGAAARRILDAEGPMTLRELGTRLVARGIGTDPDAVGRSVRAHVAVVQVPPRGVWGKGGRPRVAPFTSWTGRPLEREPAVEDVVVRYLRAFGPATTADVQRWSGLTRLRPVLERLRPRLVTFRDEAGRELFDEPDAPRPPEDAPAPVRLLGEFDNVLLGHADRRRIVPDGFPLRVLDRSRRAVGRLLVDGMLAGVWWVERDGADAALVLRPWGPVDHDALEAEATNMLAFAAPDARSRSVRLGEPFG